MLLLSVFYKNKRIKQQFIYIIIFLLYFVAQCNSAFSDDFREFLQNNYGPKEAQELERADLGGSGSFGGGDAGNGAENTPIVFVHGIMNTAATMLPLRNFFKMKGYAKGELFATSYGPKGEQVMPETGAAHCDYVKSVRRMIEAVSAYAKKPIAVIAYSMGVIISRKAILGGKCVDTNEDLGDSLTKSVQTFIGIAGPNHGAFLCSRYLLLGKYVEACNANNGMRCDSKFLDNINSEEKYEGERIFVIQTMPDEVVGNYICGSFQSTSRIKGANQMITIFGLSHTNVFLLSAPNQYNLLSHISDQKQPENITIKGKAVQALRDTMGFLESSVDTVLDSFLTKPFNVFNLFFEND